MKTINSKKYVEALFQEVLEREPFLIAANGGETQSGSFLSYFDKDNFHERVFYFDDTKDTLKERILMDREVESFLPKEALARFLIDEADPGSIMVAEKLVFLWDDDEGTSPARDVLEDEYGDVYAQCVAYGSLLGETWVDRQISVVNVSSVYESCMEIHMNGIDKPFMAFFEEALLQTIFHELRHLFYECNGIVPIGEGTPYPQDGGMEQFVEDYGDNKAFRTLPVFSGILLKEPLRELLAGKRNID